MNHTEDQSLGDKVTRAEDSAHGVTYLTELSDAAKIYAARLREALGSQTIAEFARRARVSDSAMRAYVDGDSLPGWENAVKIARTLGKDLNWFADWSHPIDQLAEGLLDVTHQVGRAIARRREHHPEDFVLLPLYDVRAAAGHGAWNDAERVKKMLAFRREWIATDLRASPDALVLIYVDGDSMEPTLSDGDVVMVDRLQVEVRSDSIYVFTQDGALLIKRLQRLPAGRFLVISDNERFGRYELDRSSFEGDSPIARMIGRVVWGGVRL